MSTDQNPIDIAAAIVATLPEMDEDVAAWVIARLMNVSGFTGAFFTPGGVREYITDAFAADEVERDVTDADVEAMLNSWEWRKGIRECLASEGGEMIQNAYNDTFDDNGNIRSGK
jgi:spermidine synthase